MKIEQVKGQWDGNSRKNSVVSDVVVIAVMWATGPNASVLSEKKKNIWFEVLWPNRRLVLQGSSGTLFFLDVST